MRLEVVLAVCSSGRLALEVPIVAVSNEDPGSMQGPKHVAVEPSPHVVLVVVLLDVFEINGMINNVEAEERNRELEHGSILFVQLESCFRACTTSLEVAEIAFEHLPTLRGRDDV